MIDTTLAPDNPFKNLLIMNQKKNLLKIQKKSWQLIMRLETKNCNMILTESLQRYQHCYEVKLINMNILQVKKYYLPVNKE